MGPPPDSAARYILSCLMPLLANKDVPRRDIAKVMWKVAEQVGLHPTDLEADSDLIKLGLARKVPDARDDEVAVEYLGFDYGRYSS